MVLNARGPDYVAHTYELVKGLFDVIRDVQMNLQSTSKKREELVAEIKEHKGDNEQKLVKNIEIVMDVFRKSVDKVARVGEKEWKEVIDQQVYVLEELLLIQDSL